MNGTTDNTGMDPMTPRRTSRARLVTKVLALAVGLFGVYCLWGMIQGIVASVSDGGLDGISLLMLPFLVLLTALGICCLYAAYRSWRHLSPRTLRLLCAAGTLSFCAALLGLTEELLPSDVREPARGVALDALVLVLFPAGFVVYRCAYRWLARPLFPSDGSAVISPGVPRWVIGVFAFLVFLATDNLLPFLIPALDRGQAGFSHLINAASLVADILIALIVYRLGVRLFCRPSAPPASENAPAA